MDHGSGYTLNLLCRGELLGVVAGRARPGHGDEVQLVLGETSGLVTFGGREPPAFALREDGAAAIAHWVTAVDVQNRILRQMHEGQVGVLGAATVGTLVPEADANLPPTPDAALGLDRLASGHWTARHAGSMVVRGSASTGRKAPGMLEVELGRPVRCKYDPGRPQVELLFEGDQARTLVHLIWTLIAWNTVARSSMAETEL